MALTKCLFLLLIGAVVTKIAKCDVEGERKKVHERIIGQIVHIESLSFPDIIAYARVDTDNTLRRFYNHPNYLDKLSIYTFAGTFMVTRCGSNICFESQAVPGHYIAQAGEVAEMKEVDSLDDDYDIQWTVMCKDESQLSDCTIKSSKNYYLAWKHMKPTLLIASEEFEWNITAPNPSDEYTLIFDETNNSEDIRTVTVLSYVGIQFNDTAEKLRSLFSEEVRLAFIAYPALLNSTLDETWLTAPRSTFDSYMVVEHNIEIPPNSEVRIYQLEGRYRLSEYPVRSYHFKTESYPITP